jgi:hypothetical protein
MAITWQNVKSPSFEGVGRMMEGAQTSVDAGLTGLLNILKQKHGLNQQIATDAFDTRTEGAMGILGGFKTAADLQQAQDSGALEQQLAGLYGANGYDKKRVREFADTRKGWLMDQGIKVNTFESQEREKEKEALRRSQEPLYAEIQNKAYSNPVEARRMLVANPNLVGYGDLLALVDSELDQLYGRNRQSKLDAQSAASSALTNQVSRLSILSTQQQMDQIKEQKDAQLALAKVRNAQQTADFDFQKKVADLVRLSPLTAGQEYNPFKVTATQQQVIDTAVKSGFLPDLEGNKQKLYSSILKNLSPTGQTLFATGLSNLPATDLAPLFPRLANQAKTIDADLDAELSAYAATGDYKETLQRGLSVQPGVDAMNAVIKNIYKEQPDLLAKGFWQSIWPGYLDRQEMLTTGHDWKGEGRSMVGLAQEGIYIPADPNDKDSVDIRIGFPYERLETAALAGVGGDEQGPVQALMKYKKGVESSNPDPEYVGEVARLRKLYRLVTAKEARDKSKATQQLRSSVSAPAK